MGAEEEILRKEIILCLIIIIPPPTPPPPAEGKRLMEYVYSIFVTIKFGVFRVLTITFVTVLWDLKL